MASKKSKTPKLDDKKGKKSEDPTPVEDPKEETPVEQSEAPLPTPEMDIQPPSTTPSTEPVYDEPTLTELIVESFEGGKDKGLYEGEGTAWFTGGHVYQGNFSEGMMHGRGIYTWADGVVYEGDFFRNQVTGRGIYKWKDGTVYDGDVVNGIRHGMGTFVSSNGSHSFTGEWVDGKRHGKGRMNYDAEGNSYYEGDWHSNYRHGWGTRRYTSGNIYEGMWFRNQRHGDGTMRWLDRGEMYSGQWEDGMQHGVGQQVWFLRRVTNSQYPLRNLYDGEFVRGVRHGYGVFYYANGSRYEGTWMENTKHGEGKFTFKNGRIYEGMFEKDHVVEFPDYTMDGSRTPDMSGIRTRTPLPTDAMSVHSNESRNTVGPSFQLDVGSALDNLNDDLDKDEELQQVKFVILRHITALKKIYNFYSCLGFEESPDNTYIMIRMQFWRFLKDCRLHHFDLTLSEMDRMCHVVNTNTYLHDPEEQILLRDFLNYLVILAYNIHGEEYSGSQPLLAWCMSKLLEENILLYSCSVKGYFYGETRKAIHSLVHFTQAHKVYLEWCRPRKHDPHEPVMKMREFLYMLKDYHLVNSDLTPKAVIDVLAHDDPNICDEQGAINLELEMTFLEFFEALVGCAEKFVTEAVVQDPSTPRASTTVTRDQSMMSSSETPSRVYSQTEEGQEDGTSPQPTATPISPAQQVASPSAGGQAETPGRERAPSSVKDKDKSDKGQDSHRTVQSSSRRRQSAVSATDNKSDHGRSKATPSQSRQTLATEPEPEPEPAPEPETRPESEIQSERAESVVADSVADVGAEDVDLDEETKLFNFWTHQLHIFFVRKFFPSAVKLAALKRMVAETLEKRRVEMELKRMREEHEAQEALQAGERRESEVRTEIVLESGDAEGSEHTETAPSEVAVHG